jgi:hypothetical protein
MAKNASWVNYKISTNPFWPPSVWPCPSAAVANKYGDSRILPIVRQLAFGRTEIRKSETPRPKTNKHYRECQACSFLDFR